MVKKTCETHEEMYRTEVLRLTDIAPQHVLGQKKASHTPTYPSGAVVSLASSFNKAQDEIQGILVNMKNDCHLTGPKVTGLKVKW